MAILNQELYNLINCPSSSSHLSHESNYAWLQ